MLRTLVFTTCFNSLLLGWLPALAERGSEKNQEVENYATPEKIPGMEILTSGLTPETMKFWHEQGLDQHSIKVPGKAASHLELSNTAVMFDGRGHAYKNVPKLEVPEQYETPIPSGSSTEDHFSPEAMKRELQRHGLEPLPSSKELHGLEHKQHDPAALLLTYEHLSPEMVPSAYGAPQREETMELRPEQLSFAEVHEDDRKMQKRTGAGKGKGSGKGGGQPGEEGYKYPTAPVIDAWKTAFKSHVDANPPAEPKRPTREEMIKADPKSWPELESDFKTRFDARETHWKTQLKKASEDQDMHDHEQYNAFTAKVLALPKGQMDEFLKTAKDTTQKNYDANAAGFEYIDDLERLARATARAYDMVAMSHWVGFDQIRAQLQEGHMVPGMSTRMMFPFGGKLAFKPNTPKLYDWSKTYIETDFAPKVIKEMAKYAGRHFTVCIHSSSNLEGWAVPFNYDKPEQREVEKIKDKDGDILEVTQGMKDMLDERFAAIQEIIQDVVKKGAPQEVPEEEENRETGKEERVEKSIKESDVTIPEPNQDLRHFGNKNDGLMPAGAVLVIAEDSLHRDAYKPPAENPPTESQLAEEEETDPAKKIKDYEKTKCAIDNMAVLQNEGQYKERSKQILTNSPFLSGLPQNLRQMNSEESEKGRPTVKQFDDFVNEGNSGNVEWIKECYAEAKLVTANLEAVKQQQNGEAAGGH